jgi:hypothetical protein
MVLPLVRFILILGWRLALQIKLNHTSSCIRPVTASRHQAHLGVAMLNGSALPPLTCAAAGVAGALAAASVALRSSDRQWADYVLSHARYLWVMPAALV